jgi:predicted DNA-binding helix-hairpin-helix protein
MATLTTKRRNRLKSSSFALRKQRKYPIDTKKRARNALARVKQHGSPSQVATVRKAVARRYPTIKVSGLRKRGKS